MPVTQAQFKASEERRSQLRQVLAQRKAERQRAETSVVESVRLYVSASLDSLRIQTELADAVASEFPAQRDDAAADVLHNYQNWLADAQAILDDLRHAEQSGMPLPEADEFRAAVRRVRVLVENADRLRSADRHATQGNLTPSKEAFDELRRRAGA
jgi:hypothetical protein